MQNCVRFWSNVGITVDETLVVLSTRPGALSPLDNRNPYQHHAFRF